LTENFLQIDTRRQHGYKRHNSIYSIYSIDVRELIYFYKSNYCGESMSENNTYDCDKCEEPIKENDTSYEVRYGFICERCFEQF
jgi:hypothetical protein